jgi:MORN repeat
MVNVKAMERTSSATAGAMKDHGMMVDTLDLEFVHGRMVDVTRGTFFCTIELYDQRLQSTFFSNANRSFLPLSEWLNGMAHGKGVETFPDGTIRHDGQWVEDEPVPN